MQFRLLAQEGGGATSEHFGIPLLAQQTFKVCKVPKRYDREDKIAPNIRENRNQIAEGKQMAVQVSRSSESNTSSVLNYSLCEREEREI